MYYSHLRYAFFLEDTFSFCSPQVNATSLKSTGSVQ